MARKGFDMNTLLIIAGAAGATIYVVASKAKAAVTSERKKTIEEIRNEGKKFVGETSDELLLAAGQLEADMDDLVSVNRIVRAGAEAIGLLSASEREQKEAEAFKKFLEIKSIFDEFNNKGHLTSARLHDLGVVIAWNDARLASGFSGKEVVNPKAIAFAKQVMDEASRRKAVIYTSDVLAGKIMTDAKGRGYVMAEELFDVDEYSPPRGLINMLDRNEWAGLQDSSSRKMWYQVLSPKTESLVKGFISDTKSGTMPIKKDMGILKMPVSWASFEEEFLPPE